ncbi:hypothetical protein DPMN_100672 [Dreissena polymorpha]|uniref:Uncharacterized protein n=1 Tax=Dreissena polymorpha TaxID=45954 RepID=A0A9D4LGC4_DREPO|nr:hypothetical protein DPMN_100672 [Dreissena polymorpha]
MLPFVGKDTVEALDVNRDDDMDSVFAKLNGLYMPGMADWSKPIIDARRNDIDLFLFFADSKNA